MAGESRAAMGRLTARVLKRAAAALLCGACTSAALAQPQPQPQPLDRERAMSVTLGFETVRLPGGERMGLLGGTLLFDVGQGWWLGPAAYGAASGERGGLFVGGVEVQHRWRLGGGQLAAGLYAGGGGGASAPVGGGLMLRPALAWLHDLGPMQAGLSLSQVRFPSGRIDGRQLGLVLGWDGRFRHADLRRAGQPASDTQRSGLGVDRILATYTQLDLRDGAAPERRIGLVGGRLDRRIDGSGWHWGLETAGAARGDASGYMEILGSLGWDVAPLDALPGLRLGGRAALGLGGGGAVPTGGGPIARAVLTLAVPLGGGLSAGLEAGRTRGLDGALTAPTLQWWLASGLEPARGASGRYEGLLAAAGWTAALQRYGNPRRVDGSRRALNTIGIKITRQAGQHLYLSGQAHSAYAGGAGAYSVGLIGAGLVSGAPQQGWQAGVEALVGASGGGGVDTSGGALAQGLVWAGWSPLPSQQWRIGAGALRSLRGNLSTPVFELSWTWRFAQIAP